MRPLLSAAARTGHARDVPPRAPPSAPSSGRIGAPSWLVGLALGAIYLIWGGTFLAIRIAVEAIPPFSMMALRCLGAATVLIGGLLLARRPAWPTSNQWRVGAVAGMLLFVGCHGLLAFEEQHVPSSVAALIGATVPLWMVALDALRPGGERPTARIVIGLLVGLAGVWLTTRGASSAGASGSGAGWGGRDVAMLLLSSASWAAGSLYGRRARGTSPVAGTAAQLACGGVALAAVAAVRGEPLHSVWHAVPTRSLLALLYLIVFGSVVAFTAYVWLLRVASPARVGTYAYVVPAVALVLGGLAGDQPVTPRLVASLAVILAGVALLSPVGTGMRRVRGR